VKLELMNAVVMAEDYERLRDWYVEALDLTLESEWTENYHYAELVKDGRLVVGIASAEEMNVTPRDRKSATVVAQLNVEDVKAFLARVREHGADVPFGPSHDEDGDFWFGGFADIEGNPVWVVEMPKLMERK
jgi:predicted enzyme related to lactoylglutathione lyase